MKAGYYAVKSGRKPGIYNTWTDCEAQVKEFSGAVYKKFDTYGDALKFLGRTPPAENFVLRTLNAYLGGARKNDTLGFCVIFKDNYTERSSRTYGSFSAKPCEKEAMWAPYFVGCYYAVREAQAMHYGQLVIYADKPGLYKWTHDRYGKYTYFTAGNASG